MKTQIIGFVILVLVLVGLYVVQGGSMPSSGQQSTSPSQSSPAPSANDAAMKSLSIP